MFGRLFSGGVERSRSENHESDCGFRMQRSLRNAEARLVLLDSAIPFCDSVTSVVKQNVQPVVIARRADALPLAFSLV